MKYHRTLLLAAILLLTYPNHAVSQKEIQEQTVAFDGSGGSQAASDKFKKYHNVAEQGYASVQFHLGMMYLQGDGITQDYVEAGKWFHKAAEQGNVSAQCMLGAIYASGMGVAKDSVEAYMWFTLAIEEARNTQTPFLHKATELSHSLAKGMTPQQIKTAKNLADKWKPVSMPTPKQITSIVQEPILIKKVEPVYPELAKRARISGSVVLVAIVDEEGNVVEAKVLKSVHSSLNSAAIAAVKQWKYSPTLLDGVPIPVTATVTLNFDLYY